MAQPWTTSASATISGSAITLVEGPAFCISDSAGNMVPELPHGLFFRDTRFLSLMRLRVNGAAPEPLAATAPDPFSGVFVLRDHPKFGRADSNLMIFRHRYVGRGMREDIVVHNFSEEPAFCSIELLLGSDFADLFEVKEGRVEKLGDLSVHADASRLTFEYKRGGFRRASHVDFSIEPRINESTATYEVIVPARGDWTTCIQLTPVIDGHDITPRYLCGQPVERATPVERLVEWRRRLPTITSDHDQFRLLLERSSEDLAALRIFDPDFPDRAVVAAGAPWFMTLFGRDSLLTSWMTMIVDPDLALGTLETLARFQGTEVNPLTEEEPGRILHEMRFGETASLSLGGGRVYYGTVDATPLFVMLLGELSRWGNRRDEVDALLPAADRALEWITNYGDRDGDGYVEYQRTNDRGLENQGWKDSWDSTRFGDGTLAQTPVALCEVQGYVYAALVARSHCATEAGDAALAATLRKRAETLKENFNRDFWIDDGEYFAMGLDRDKRPLDAITSNMGQCLWTGIVDEEKAPAVARHLLDRSMFSGWGIRTLSEPMVGYNPISYHNGSVWPHDNALCAAGLMRYGFVEEAHRVMQGLVDASAYFGDLLPELFAGLGRKAFGFPVSYPTSCSPQAWAAASPLLFLRTMLRFEPDIRNSRLHLAPAVPEWIGLLRLERIPIMGGFLTVEMRGEELKLLDSPPGLTIERVPQARDLLTTVLPDVRHRFPGLGDGWVRLDGPAGTLPVDSSIDAMHAYFRSSAPANVGGAFAASAHTGAMVDDVRAGVGALLGASGGQVIFGASSTALMFAYTRALARTWEGGERIVCTELDHDSNITPWVLAAQDAGADVTVVSVAPSDGSLDLADLEQALTGRPVAWVALSGASNLTGFAPDLRAAAAMSHAAGARLHVDAVARAPHLPIDVNGWGIDSLVTSPYKWYGPHAGVLVMQPELLHGVEPYRVRPADYPGPERWETGTGAFETVAGIGGAAAFMAEQRWETVIAGEAALLARLEEGLRAIPGVIVYPPAAAEGRAPTTIFNITGTFPDRVAADLAARRIAVWSGDNYACELIDALGLREGGGVVRAGIARYTTADDIDSLVAAVAEIASIASITSGNH